LAEQMAHLPIGGADGSLKKLEGLSARHRFFIHVNNSNPVLREDSDEHLLVRRAGWEIAYDGMEVTV
jgi:pyrroloquinoline quinone biosynthesis protein B